MSDKKLRSRPRINDFIKENKLLDEPRYNNAVGAYADWAEGHIQSLEKEREPINIIFDGPPAPEAGRFVEVENDKGKSISIGEWIERSDGYWALRIDIDTQLQKLKEAFKDLWLARHTMTEDEHVGFETLYEELTPNK